MRTRIIGVVLILVSLGVDAWLGAGTAEAVGEGRSITGHILGFVLFSLPFLAVGIYLLMISRGEARSESKADKQRTILNAVTTRGRVSVADLAIECNLTREQVRDHIYDIIGKDLFRGYVNWDKGELVSAEAAQIKEDTCPNCGGKVELAGKGLVRCPYCGTETYLSPPTPRSTETSRAKPEAAAPRAPAPSAPAGSSPSAPSAPPTSPADASWTPSTPAGEGTAGTPPQGTQQPGSTG
jgi:hypothetical protein